MVLLHVPAGSAGYLTMLTRQQVQAMQLRWSSNTTTAATRVSTGRYFRSSRQTTSIITAAVPSHQPIAVITGCSSGIGKETALLLAQKGWHVFAGARKDVDLQQLADSHHNITPTYLDVTKQDSIQSAVQQVEDAVRDNGLQLLINNAGIGMVAPVEFFPLDDFRQVMEVNFFGALAMSQACIPLLKRGNRKGRILNISSVAGHFTLPFWSSYCSSKFALEGLSECLRYELAPQGIKVVIIKPGPVVTPIWENSRAKSYDATAAVWQEASRVYGSQLQLMEASVKEAERTAIPVSQVVDLIYEAATTPNPKSKYHIGDNAAISHWAKRLLPDAVWESIVSKKLADGTSPAESLLTQKTEAARQREQAM